MSGLRQRRKGGEGGLSEMVESVKALDLYAKPLADFRVKTFVGGAITVVSGLIIVFLIVSEFLDYRTVQYIPELRVDPSTKDKMEIFINVTFPQAPCYVLGVDVMDVSGEHFHDVDHNIYKVRLDPNGEKVSEEKGQVGMAAAEEAKKLADSMNTTALSDPNYCGSCYGGDHPDGRLCCNTCEEVRKGYGTKGWGAPNYDDVEQCVRDGYTDKMKKQAKEGCQVYGTLEVNRVPGNVHIAPGTSFQQMNLHVHDMAQFLANPDFMFSHTIHEFRFGKMYEGMTGVKNPLDGTAKITSNRFVMYQYYVKVVSTRIHYQNGTVFPSNQYSVTEHEKDVSPQPGMSVPSGLPGVFFNFEISPMQVIYTEYTKALSHFLTDICAVVGGVFTVAGLIDSFLYSASSSGKQKMDFAKGK